MKAIIEYVDRKHGSSGGTCSIRTFEERGECIAVIYWPAGVQDFPDVLRGESSRFGVADAMVRRLGFVPRG